MSAFFLFDNIKVKDADKLEKYVTLVGPVVARFGGRYRAVGGNTTIVEGGWSPVNPVLIEFESLDAARTWYDSAEYRPLKALRQEAVDCNGVLIEGL